MRGPRNDPRIGETSAFLSHALWSNYQMTDNNKDSQDSFSDSLTSPRSHRQLTDIFTKYVI